jgi:methyltransferase-like protein
MRARKILYEKLVSVSDDKIAREFYSDLLRIKEHRPLITKEDTVWIAD